MENLYIDIGSTNIKFSTDSDKSQSALPFLQSDDSTAGHYTVDSTLLYKTIKSIIDKYIGSVKNVYLSVQMHGYVLGYGDKTFSNYISWQDKRAKGYESEFTRLYQSHFDKNSGTSIKTNLSAVSLFYNKKFGLEKLEQVTSFYTLGSFLAYMLTDNNSTHITDATCSGFYRVDGSQNSQIINGVFGQKVSMPIASLKVKSVGTYQDINIFTPIGDQQWNILINKTIAKNDIIINLGTAGQVCKILQGFECGDFESRPYFDGDTLATVTNLMGGKYIFENRDVRDLMAELSQNYISAIEKVGYNKTIHIIGGAVEYNKELLKNVEKNIHNYFKLKRLEKEGKKQ